MKYRTVILVDAYSRDQDLHSFECEDRGDRYDCVKDAIVRLAVKLGLDPAEDHRLRLKVVSISEPKQTGN